MVRRAAVVGAAPFLLVVVFFLGISRGSACGVGDRPRTLASAMAAATANRVWIQVFIGFPIPSFDGGSPLSPIVVHLLQVPVHSNDLVMAHINRVRAEIRKVRGKLSSAHEMSISETSIVV